MKIPEIPKSQNILTTMSSFVTPVQSKDDSCSKMIDRQMIQDANREIPFYSDPVCQPHPKQVKLPLPRITGSLDINLELNIDFVENSPFQEGVILETYQRPDKPFIQEPRELESLNSRDRLVEKFLPKQTDIDKYQKYSKERYSRIHIYLSK